MFTKEPHSGTHAAIDLFVISRFSIHFVLRFSIFNLQFGVEIFKRIIEATRRIRSLDTDFANVPIIMLTADNSVEISSKSLAAGANVFLTKPVLLEELVSAFDYVLKTPKALQL